MLLLCVGHHTQTTSDTMRLCWVCIQLRGKGFSFFSAASFALLALCLVCWTFIFEYIALTSSMDPRLDIRNFQHHFNFLNSPTVNVLILWMSMLYWYNQALSLTFEDLNIFMKVMVWSEYFFLFETTKLLYSKFLKSCLIISGLRTAHSFSTFPSDPM